MARGLTLLELIILMVVFGVLAATAAVKWSGRIGNVRAPSDQVAQDIRYTQSLAMAKGQRHRVYFYANSYRISDGDGSWVVHPATGSTNAVSLPSGVSFQSNGFAAGGYLAFDALGKPYNGTTPLAAATSVSITDGSETRTIVVRANTGAVTVQ